MKNNQFSRKKRQLSNLVKLLQRKLNVADQSPQLIESIKLKIKLLLQELSGLVAKHQLKKILGSFAVMFGFTISTSAQSFIAPVENPFGLTPSVTYLQFPEFVDLDNDGDMDLFIGNGSSFDYYENTGTNVTPAYAAPVSNPFGLSTSSVYINAPAFADLDNDGDLDLLTGEYNGSMNYYENIGNANTPSFSNAVTLPFGLTSSYNIAIPDFVDIDNDGDFDLMVTEYYGTLQYYENIGTSSAPAFANSQANPFGLTLSYGYVNAPEFADLDNDGDQDLLLGGYYGSLEFYENTGSASNPTFIAPINNPFGLTSVYYTAMPSIADIDNDGDLDLLVSEYYGKLQYFQNVQQTTSIKEVELDGSISPNPFKNILNFNFDQDIIHVEFVNLLGQSVLEIENPKLNVDVSNLEEGVYIVKCRDAHNNISTYNLQKL